MKNEELITLDIIKKVKSLPGNSKFFILHSSFFVKSRTFAPAFEHWSLRLSVRTRDFHSLKRSSTLLGTTRDYICHLRSDALICVSQTKRTGDREPQGSPGAAPAADTASNAQAQDP